LITPGHLLWWPLNSITKESVVLNCLSLSPGVALLAIAMSVMSIATAAEISASKPLQIPSTVVTNIKPSAAAVAQSQMAIDIEELKKRVSALEQELKNARRQ
jgi:hypothetical protein